ncbi:MAG: MarR family winged helix-turn-helix transcriptional regulator [Oscillospiraceae bacterium]
MNGAEITASIRGIIKGYEKFLDAAGDSCGLSRTERDSLLFLYNNPKHDTARDIVKYRMIPKANVSQAVDSLIAKGHLERAACPEDRRIVRLRLTDSGKTTAAKLKEAQTRFSAALFEGLSDEERATLEKADRLIKENIQRILNAKEN